MTSKKLVDKLKNSWSYLSLLLFSSKEQNLDHIASHFCILMAEDAYMNDLYYTGYDLFRIAQEKRMADPDRLGFEKSLDAHDDLFDILQSVGLYSFKLDMQKLTTKIQESKWADSVGPCWRPTFSFEQDHKDATSIL